MSTMRARKKMTVIHLQREAYSRVYGQISMGMYMSSTLREFNLISHRTGAARIYIVSSVAIVSILS